MDSSVNISAAHKSGKPLSFSVKEDKGLRNYKVETRQPLTTDHELRVSNPGESEAKQTFKK